MARKIPRENSFQPEPINTSASVDRVVVLANAASNIFTAKYTSNTEPPSHSTQRTVSYCSKTVMPARAAMA
ncbi:hypothetical protein D3C80_813380 [compost metagenome]